MRKSRVFALLVAASALGACEFVGSGVAPSITGRPGGSAGQPAAIVPLDVATLGAPTGSPVGARIGQFRADLAQLQQSAVEQVQRGKLLLADMDANVAGYQITVGTIKARQPGGAVSGESIPAWQHAQAQLRTISSSLDQMNALSGEVAKNVAYAAYLQESIRAANAAPGAVEEDRRQLKMLEESTARTAASLDQLLDALRQRVQRESHFLGSEGAKLAQIAPPAAAATANAAPPPAPPVAPSSHLAGPAGAGLAAGQPFVVIRFDDPAAAYEQQLYEAVSAALVHSPHVAFDLVAAAPDAGTPEEAAQNAEAARASAERVMRSLLAMGLPAERISVSQVADPNVQGSEVRLYVR